ncbi:MAG: GNAT family N-acetyltransferase [Ferruginibacter sp.]
MTIKVSDTISLELLGYQHAEETFKLIRDNSIHLREWLPWVDYMQTLQDFNNYIYKSNQLHTDGIDFGFVILLENVIVGRIGLHHINAVNKIGAIGYWLAQNFAGKGIIIQSCKT